MKLYVASSWRNIRQQTVVGELRQAGFDVYDFKNPPGGTGFDWANVDPNWKQWTPQEFREGLSHPIAHRGFQSDMTALDMADAVVLVMPCGRSAHIEAGYALGAHKPVFILLSMGEPELMYKMAELVLSVDELISKLDALEAKRFEPFATPLDAPLDMPF